MSDGDTLKVIIAELRTEALCQRAAIEPLRAAQAGIIEQAARAVAMEAFERMASRLEAGLSEPDPGDSSQDGPQVIDGMPYAVLTQLPETIGGQRITWTELP